MEFLTVEIVDWVLVFGAGFLFIKGQDWAELIILIAAIANLFVK